MPNTTKYDLTITKDSNPVHLQSTTVYAREIPKILTREVYNGVGHEWAVVIYHGTDPVIDLHRNPVCGYVVNTWNPASKILIKAVEQTAYKLNHDLLNRYQPELARLFDAGIYRDLFELRSSGSEMRYTSVKAEGKPEIERLSYGTVVKVRRHWTRRYSYVDTYTIKDLEKALNLCYSIRGGLLRISGRTGDVAEAI